MFIISKLLDVQKRIKEYLCLKVGRAVVMVATVIVAVLAFAEFVQRKKREERER